MRQTLIDPYPRLLAERSGSDLYFSTGIPPKVTLEGSGRLPRFVA